MKFFKKNKEEVIDFSLMQKKGLMPKESTSQEIIDFRTNKTSDSSQSSGFDFLGSLAKASTDNTFSNQNTQSSDSFGSVTESLRAARLRRNQNSDINELRIKLDDNEFRLKSLIERVKEIERRIGERGI